MSNELIKDLELKRSKLYSKAFKQFPRSPLQNKTKQEIDILTEKIKKMKAKKKLSGWRKGGTAMIEEWEKQYKKLKNVRVVRAPKKGKRKPGTFKVFNTLKGVAGEKHTDTKSHNVNIRVSGNKANKAAKQFYKQQKIYNKAKKVNETIYKKFADWEYPIPPVYTENWNVTDWTNWITKYGKKISGIGDTNSFFDVSVIKDLDDLKQQYRALALKYHPDRGGTTAQMQQVNAEHERLRNLLLSGSSLTDEQKKNEIEIDETFRVIIDQVIHIEGIEVELIGKWLWIGSTLNPERNWQFETPTYNALKQAGLDYIKKQGRPYMVYKGVESKGRGKLTKAEIEAKYGKTKFETKGRKRINSPFKINNVKLKAAVKRLTKALDKRPV